MMEIYLMQHGSAYSKDVDPDRQLSPVGREQIIKSAQAVRRMGLGFDVVLSSPKARARQTAGIICELIGYSEDEIAVTELLKATTGPAETIEFLKSHKKKGALLVVGHLPNLAKVAGELLSPGNPPNIKFQNGGLTRIDVWEENQPEALLRWHLTPLQMQILAGA
jgi:phosphohistidine phosphatase